MKSDDDLTPDDISEELMSGGFPRNPSDSVGSGGFPRNPSSGGFPRKSRSKNDIPSIDYCLGFSKSESETLARIITREVDCELCRDGEQPCPNGREHIMDALYFGIGSICDTILKSLTVRFDSIEVGCVVEDTIDKNIARLILELYRVQSIIDKINTPK